MLSSQFVAEVLQSLETSFQERDAVIVRWE